MSATEAADGGKASVTDRARSERRLGWWLAGPAFVVMLLVTAYPIVQAFYESLFKYRLTDPGAREFTGLNNYVVVLGDPIWWQAVGVTVLITVITVAIEAVLGFALALVMHRALKRLRPILRTAILIPYAIITVVSAFAWFYAFDINSGFVNSWFGWAPGISENTNWFGEFGTSVFVIIASEIWKTTPFISLLLLAGLAQVPEDLQEAAKVDGATWWQRMYKVTIPNMKAAIMVALLFRTLDAFRIFDNVFIMTQGANNTEVVSFLAYRQTISRLEIGLGSAVSVLLFLCVVLISFVFIKLFKVDLASARGSGDGRGSALPRHQGLVVGRRIAVIVYALFPVAWIVSLSFKTPSDLATGEFLPTNWVGDNYDSILRGDAQDLFLSSLRNSVGISLIATFISVVLAMFAAYAIARLDFPGKRLILTTALAVAIFPVISIVTPLFNLWRNIGLYDTWPGLIIPYLSLTLPISIWTMSAFFRQIPWELEQAAQVDGATTWQAFRKVIVPLATPGVFTTAIISFFIAWNDFIYGISLTSTRGPGRSPRHWRSSPARHSSRSPRGPSRPPPWSSPSPS